VAAPVWTPDVVTQLMGASRRGKSIGGPSVREREVLALIAEGRSNSAIAFELAGSQGTVYEQVATIVATFELPQSPGDHWRVRAVLRFLDS
jgi:DNA-binding NarL/FixJ family response regulator